MEIYSETLYSLIDKEKFKDLKIDDDKIYMLRNNLYTLKESMETYYIDINEDLDSKGDQIKIINIIFFLISTILLIMSFGFIIPGFRAIKVFKIN